MYFVTFMPFRMKQWRKVETRKNACRKRNKSISLLPIEQKKGITEATTTSPLDFAFFRFISFNRLFLMWRSIRWCQPFQIKWNSHVMNSYTYSLEYPRTQNTFLRHFESHVSPWMQSTIVDRRKKHTEKETKDVEEKRRIKANLKRQHQRKCDEKRKKNVFLTLNSFFFLLAPSFFFFLHFRCEQPLIKCTIKSSWQQ